MNYVIVRNQLTAKGKLEPKVFGPYDQHKANALLAAYFVRTQNRIKHHGVGDEQEVSYVTGRMDVANLGVHVERWEVLPLNPKMEN